jgi:hypothetical protein
MNSEHSSHVMWLLDDQPGVPMNTTAPPPATGYPQPTALKPDGGVMHFVRFLLISIVMSALGVVFVGIIWAAIALSSTGRRKRDLLMYFIPVWGIIVNIQTLWRYTAKNVYWSPRSDRPSKSLFSGS